MKFNKTIIFSSLTAGALALALTTQSPAFPGGGGGKGMGGPGMGHGGGMGQGLMGKLIHSLNLTNEQKLKLKPIMEEMRPKFQAAREQAKGNGPEAMKAAMGPLFQEIRAKVDPILTAAQRSTLDQTMADFKNRKPGMGREGFMSSLNLTPEQKEKLKALRQSAQKNHHETMQAEMKKILTPEQFQKLQEMKSKWKESHGGKHGMKHNQ